MSVRTYPISCLFLLAMGCGGAESPLDRAPSAANRVEPTKIAENPGKVPGTPPISEADPGIAKVIESKSGDGATRIELGAPPAIRANLGRDKPLFYPVLRHFDEGDLFTQKVAYVPVTKGLGVFACRRTKRPDGGMGIDYVMKSQLADYGLEQSQVIEACYENFFKEKIEIKALKQADDLMLSFSSSGGLVTALIGHSSSYPKLSKMLGTGSIAVLIDGPDILLATTKGSSFEAKFPEIIRRSHHKTGALNLDPAVYHWTENEGLTLISGRREDRLPGPPADERP